MSDVSRRALALQLAAMPLAASAVRSGEVEERYAVALGTVVTLTLVSRDARRRERAFERAFARIYEIERRLGLQHAESEINALNRTGRLDVASPGLRAVLDASLALAAASGGAFDPTVQPLWAVRGCGDAPLAPGRVAAARALVDWRAVAREGDGVRLARTGMGLTLNGIAQGFAADAAGREIRRAGIEAALVDTGEFRAFGRPPRAPAWRLGIPDPFAPERLRAVVDVTAGGIATSAAHPMRCRIEPDAHHVVDARTGRSRPALASVTVHAPTALLADGLATALLAGGSAIAPRLLGAHPRVRAWAVAADGALRRLDGKAA